MGITDAQPYYIDVPTTETPAYTFDVTQYTVAGQTLANPVQTMKVLASNVVVPNAFSGNPAISGTTVQVKILGSALQVGQKYRCIITFDVLSGGVTQSTLSCNVIITCPY